MFIVGKICYSAIKEFINHNFSLFEVRLLNPILKYPQNLFELIMAESIGEAVA